MKERVRRFQRRSLNTDPGSSASANIKKDSPFDFRRVLGGGGGTRTSSTRESRSRAIGVFNTRWASYHYAPTTAAASHQHHYSAVSVVGCSSGGVPSTAAAVAACPVSVVGGVELAVEAIRRRQQISVQQLRRIHRTVSSDCQPLPAAIPLPPDHPLSSAHSAATRQRFLSSCSVASVETGGQQYQNKKRSQTMGHWDMLKTQLKSPKHSTASCLDAPPPAASSASSLIPKGSVASTHSCPPASGGTNQGGATATAGIGGGTFAAAAGGTLQTTMAFGAHSPLVNQLSSQLLVKRGSGSLSGTQLQQQQQQQQQQYPPYPYPVVPKGGKFKMAHESFRARMLQEMQDQSTAEPVFMTKKRTADSKFSEFKGGDFNKYTAQSYTIRNGVEIFGANIHNEFGICGWILTILSYILIFLTLPISACMSIKVVQEYERAVIFRLGRLMPGGAKGPGIFFIVPCIDTYRKVDLRVLSFEVPPQEILSKDSVTVAVDAVVYFRISNATISVTNVEDASRSTKLLAQTTLRNILGTKTLAEMLSDREAISVQMQVTLDEATEPWGVKVERVEVKDVRLPVQLQRAMAAEAEAAREARAKVIVAEGEQKASRALKEAADVIAESPQAIQLRYLQTLNSISAEKNSTIIFPFPIDLLSSLLHPQQMFGSGGGGAGGSGQQQQQPHSRQQKPPHTLLPQQSSAPAQISPSGTNNNINSNSHGYQSAAAYGGGATSCSSVVHSPTEKPMLGGSGGGGLHQQAPKAHLL